MVQYYTSFFFQAVLFLILQALFFDHINLFGFGNPAVYLVLLINYRLNLNQFGFILISFAIGFTLDVITQTAGAHSVASITVAFFRPFIINYSFGKNNELTNPLNTSISLSSRMLYILSIILLHQFIFSFFAFFSFSLGYKIMLYFVVNSLFSFGIIIASLYLFRPKE